MGGPNVLGVDEVSKTVKRILVVAVVLGAVAMAAHSLAPGALVAYGSRLAPPNAQVVGIWADGYAGTGFTVSAPGVPDGVILTAKHVVDGLAPGSRVDIHLPGQPWVLSGWVLHFAPSVDPIQADVAAIYAPQLRAYADPDPLPLESDATQDQGYVAYSVICVRPPDWDVVEYPLAVSPGGGLLAYGGVLPGCSGGPVVGYTRDHSAVALGVLSGFSSTDDYSRYGVFMAGVPRSWLGDLGEQATRLHLRPVSWLVSVAAALESDFLPWEVLWLRVLAYAALGVALSNVFLFIVFIMTRRGRSEDAASRTLKGGDVDACAGPAGPADR